MMIRTNLEHIGEAIDFASYKEEVARIDRSIKERTGKGSDFLGWVDQADEYLKSEELPRLIETGKRLRENYEVLVVCGIGGSYLGARAAIEALTGTLPKKGIDVLWLGETFDPTYISRALAYLKDKKFCVNVISKSGTTTETALSFRLLRNLLEERDGKEAARKAIVATTDGKKGALLTLSRQEGYETFVLPGDIGGRYSVQTAVGLLPMTAMGIDVTALLNGSKDAAKEYREPDVTKNEAYKYAVCRHHLYEKGKKVELFCTYLPTLVQLTEWWKQLFGESEGKEGKSLFPASACFSTDLHSLGQFIQEGSQIFFETILHLEKPEEDLPIPGDKDDLDGLNYLAGKPLSFVQERAFRGVLEAHAEGASIPNIVLEMERMNAYSLGYLFYFFEKACAMSAYLNGVNPFDQPGVEVYKRNMFRLLGKPGF